MQVGADGGAADKEARAKAMQDARSAQHSLRVRDSDALSALAAVCAFEAAGETDAFCRSDLCLCKCYLFDCPANAIFSTGHCKKNGCALFNLAFSILMRQT